MLQGTNSIDTRIQFTTHYLQDIAINAKLNDITRGVVQDINQLCQCGLSAERITESAFQCFENSDQQVTFRARLHGASQVTSSQLVAYLETFVAQTDSTIAVQHLCLDVDNSCPVVINSFGDPQCTSKTTADSTTAIIGGVVAVIVVMILAVTVIIIIIIVAFITRSRSARSSIHQDVG